MAEFGKATLFDPQNKTGEAGCRRRELPANLPLTLALLSAIPLPPCRPALRAAPVMLGKVDIAEEYLEHLYFQRTKAAQQTRDYFEAPINITEVSGL